MSLTTLLKEGPHILARFDTLFLIHSHILGHSDDYLDLGRDLRPSEGGGRDDAVAEFASLTTKK